MSVEPCSKLTATDGRGAKVKWQWVPDNWSCDEKAPPTEPSCSGSWNEQITTLGRAETRTARIVSDCADNAAEVGRPGALDTVKSQCSNFELYRLRHWQPMEDVVYMQCVCVCMCVAQRKWAVLSLGQQVNVHPHVFDPKQDYLGAMVVEVDFLMKKKSVVVSVCCVFTLSSLTSFWVPASSARYNTYW